MSENNNTTVVEDAKSKFVINELITEHEKFEHIADRKFISSTDLCTMVSAVLQNVYSDYEGCNFDILPGSNIPIIKVYFNHRNQVKKTADGEELPFACTKENTDTKTVNTTLRSTRSYNSRLLNGDRYFLTEEGRGLGEFVIDAPNFKTKDNEVIWNKITSEVADGNFASNQQYTMVTALSAAKIVEAIFGRTDADGISWVYDVFILRSIPSYTMFSQGVSTAGYMLSIERVSENEVLKLAKQFGLSLNSGLNIIR